MSYTEHKVELENVVAQAVADGLSQRCALAMLMERAESLGIDTLAESNAAQSLYQDAPFTEFRNAILRKYY